MAALFGVAFAILLLPRERELDERADAPLPSLPDLVFAEFAIPPVAERPHVPAVRRPVELRVSAPEAGIPTTATMAVGETSGAEPIFAFTTALAEPPSLVSTPLTIFGVPDAVMSPPAIEDGEGHVVAEAFRQTGAAVRLALRKTGEGVKTAFTSIPW